MSQISLPEACDLLSKVFNEGVRITAFFVSPYGSRAKVRGFINSATRANGLVITVLRPPELGDVWINAFPFDEGQCEFTYGEVRELSDDVRSFLGEGTEESALVIRFVKSGEVLALFFTL